MTKKVNLCFLLIFIFNAYIFSETSKIEEKLKLSVDDAVKLAIENNVSVERSEITLNGLKRSKNHSWNSVSPSVSLGATAGIPIDGLSDNKSNYDAQYGISATVSLSLSANLYTQIQTAKINYEIGEINFSDAIRSIELSVRQSFNGLLYEREYIILQEKNLEIAKQQYDNNRAKYNQGRLSEIDVLSAEVNYKSSIPTVENARTTYINDLEKFEQILGIETDKEIELTGNLNELIILDDINLDGVEIVSSNIKTLEKRIEAAKNTVLDKRFSAYAPSLNANFSFRDQYWYSGYSGEKKYNSSTGTYTAESAPDAKKTTTLTLSATIPLDGFFPWTSKNDAIDTAKDNLRDYELQLENARRTLKLSVDSSLRSIKQSQAAIKSKQANVNLAELNYKRILEAYNRGTKDLINLQNANTSLLSAQLSLENEIRTLVNAILNLENTIGVPFGTLGRK